MLPWTTVSSRRSMEDLTNFDRVLEIIANGDKSRCSDRRLNYGQHKAEGHADLILELVDTTLVRSPKHSNDETRAV